MGGPKLIACVGDVHGLWNQESEEALCSLQPDLALFVGDFGEEDVALCSQIARVPERKAVILGNHDGWYSTTQRGKGAGSFRGVEEQLELLGEEHVGLSANGFPDLGLSVVGCRPFSAGGANWKRFARFYNQMYGLRNFGDSTMQIVANATSEPAHHDLVFLAHNGPTGLGASADSPCGLDFRPEEGDFGDSDMEEAIASCLQKGRRIPLAVFGHMHQKLHRCAFPRTERRMFHLDEKTGVAYLNCAVVPRIRRKGPGEDWEGGEVSEGREGGSVCVGGRDQHNFVLCWLSEENRVERVCSVWLEKQEDGSFARAEETEWYSQQAPTLTLNE